MQHTPENTATYSQLPAYILLRQLLPALSHFRFGVGGSLLLTELGLLQQARDLDLVCAAEDFATISQALAEVDCPQLRPLVVPPHPIYQSECFARFVAPDGTEVDLMANISTRQSGRLTHWHFDQTQLERRHDIPWMSAAQWLELYQLFQRTERVTVLQQYLAALP